MTDDEIANCHPDWLARQTHRQKERSPAIKERLKNLNEEERNQYIAATDRLYAEDERKANIEWKKKWEEDHPWEKPSQTFLTDESFSVKEGDSLYSKKIRELSDGFSKSMNSLGSKALGVRPSRRSKKKKMIVLPHDSEVENYHLFDLILEARWKRCCVCMNEFTIEFFSYNQWTKPSPSCKECIETSKKKINIKQ